nr:hypothetical protein [Tanacetum cinerariifolium]
MDISLISVSSDSSEGSVRTPAGRVILFESDLYEDPSSNHIPPLPAVSPFLSSADDTTDSDTPSSLTYDYFSLDDSARDSSSDSSSKASSDFHSDASSDYSSRYSLSDHSSPDLPSTSAGPSHKRHRSPMKSIPALLHIYRSLSLVRADLIPSPKRVRDFGYLLDVEVDLKETSLSDDVMVRDALRDKGIDARFIVKAVDQEDSETGTRGSVVLRVERVTHLVMPEDTPEPTQDERAIECTYETMRSLVERFHDHIEAIPFHHTQVPQDYNASSAVPCLFIHILCYSLSLYPFTECYAQPYFFSCLIRQRGVTIMVSEHGFKTVGPKDLTREDWIVNTRTDANLSAAVQNALQILLPQIRAEIREEFRTISGPSDSGGNPPPVTIHTWLELFNKQNPRSFEKATAPVDAKN